MGSGLRILAASMMLCAVMTSCSDPKAANEKNFSAAIGDYLKTVPACMELHIGKLPGDFDVSAPMGGFGDKPKAPTLDNFYQSFEGSGTRPFADQGFVSFAMNQRQEPNRFGSGTETRYYVHGTLTDKGKVFYRAVRNQAWGDRTSFCYGEKELVSVENFTEPSNANMLGQTASSVHYTWRLTNIADWAKDSKLQAADGSVQQNLQAATTPAKDSMDLVLTNKGWMAYALLRN